ncbi:MAG: LysM peptidoglycan-binding domain-containing M23 family metallopeptidase [bacterium]
MLSKSLLLIVLPIMSFWGCATLNPMGEQRDQIILVKVKKNDTLNRIAERHNTTWQAIASLNRDQLTNGLREGQELRVRVNDEMVNSADGSQVAGNGFDDDQGEDFLPKRKRGFFFSPRPSGPPELVLPAPGRVSSHFGKRGRRLHKGIDIVAMVGTPIVASADGEVIFSGRQRGYGSTVVIDHGDYMTLYAHASKLIARNGDKVRRGDFIAKVGKTGNARGAHLHFELRDRENKPLDPMKFFDRSNVAMSRSSEKSMASEIARDVDAKLKQKNGRSASKARPTARGKKRLLYARD